MKAVAVVPIVGLVEPFAVVTVVPWTVSTPLLTLKVSSGKFVAMPPVSPADVADAQERIEGVVHRTPLDRSTTLAELSGAASVALKLENLQRTGSFKIRGAYNHMAQLSAEQQSRGVIASSAGNHAQGVALAGQLLDVEVTIVVPEVTPAAKIRAAQGYGAEVIVAGDIYERSYERARTLAEDEGYEFVHPFNDDRIIAGQGTIGLELADQYPELDVVLVAVGGGGLVSGIATALQSIEPDVRVIGVQPTGAAHAKPSLERGEIHELSTVETIADGIADTRLLERTFAVMRECVDDVVTVTDRDLTVAVALLAERAKLVVEPAGAAPVAALLAGAVDVRDEHVAAIISGGNVDLTTHAGLVRAGLENLDRYARLTVSIDDWPRGLSNVVEALEDRRVALREFQPRWGTDRDGTDARSVDLELESGDGTQLHEAIDALDALTGVAVTERSHSFQ